jgi:hypothetical protein
VCRAWQIESAAISVIAVVTSWMLQCCSCHCTCRHGRHHLVVVDSSWMWSLQLLLSLLPRRFVAVAISLLYSSPCGRCHVIVVHHRCRHHLRGCAMRCPMHAGPAGLSSTASCMQRSARSVEVGGRSEGSVRVCVMSKACAKSDHEHGRGVVVIEGCVLVMSCCIGRREVGEKR